jgi:two-component system, NarL family, response regulator LiaR
MAEERTVVVCDDHPLVREAETSLLERASYLVRAAVGTCGEALAAVERHKPRLLLLDLVLPDGLGSSIVSRVRGEARDTAVVLLTSFSDDAHMSAALRSGADGILLKSIEPTHLLACLETVLMGETVLDRQLALRLAKLARIDARATPLHLLRSLSGRELDVLRRIARGERNSEIAAGLGLREKTVKSHVSSVLFKLNLADRTQAAVFAWRAGLGEPEIAGG